MKRQDRPGGQGFGGARKGDDDLPEVRVSIAGQEILGSVETTDGEPGVGEHLKEIAKEYLEEVGQEVNPAGGLLTEDNLNELIQNGSIDPQYAGDVRKVLGAEDAQLGDNDLPDGFEITTIGEMRQRRHYDKEVIVELTQAHGGELPLEMCEIPLDDTGMEQPDDEDNRIYPPIQADPWEPTELKVDGEMALKEKLVTIRNFCDFLLQGSDSVDFTDVLRRF